MGASDRAGLVLSSRTPPLALRNVVQGRARSFAAIAGIAFALVMVLLQLGFLEAVKVTAGVNYRQLDFDLALVSPEFEQFYDAGSFPKERLMAAESVPGVAAARPLWVSMNVWRCPPYPLENPPEDADAAAVGAIERLRLGEKYPRPLQRRELLVLGIDIDRNPFREPIRSQVEAAGARLRGDGHVLFNADSNPDFGWSLREGFGDWELGRRRVDIVGSFTLPRSFGADAAVLCDEATFARSIGLPRIDRVPFGLVTVAPGANRGKMAAALAERLPDDVEVLDRDRLEAVEQHYWVNQTATGQIFRFGVLIAMLVAAIVVYQVLSNDIRKRLPEYATLKAMGHTDGYLGRVVLAQALIYSMAAFVPAVAVSAGLYVLTEKLANIPMRLTAANLALVFGLTVAFGVGSGLLTVRKLRAANPADLY